jgi:predicted dehydrogenase
MNKKRLGFGIVGCGMIADFHARAIKAMKGVKLECVFDVVGEKAENLAKKYKCRAFDNYEEFLACPDLDIVTIATPSGLHLEPVVKAAKAKKHIICEKPLEITLERIDKMIKACRQNRVTLSGIFPRRFNDATRLFKKAVDDGRLGKITMADAYIKWYRTQEYYDKGDWRGTWKLDGGGALMNQSIHTIDLVNYLGGGVKSVRAWADRSIHKRIEVEDIAVAMLRFKNGALGVIEGSTSCYSPTGHAAEVHICGSDGSIFMQDDRFTKWEFRKMRASDKRVLKNYSALSGAGGAGAADPSAIEFKWHQKNFEDTVRAIRAGRKPGVDGKEARKSVELILAIYKSALSGGKQVDLPLKKTPALRRFR